MVKKLLFFTCLLFVAAIATAQITTSSISGKVVAGGEVVTGATVQAIHQPSGSTYGAVTNGKGRYSIQGMRVGGPYKIVITYIGYSSKEFNEVNLSLGVTSTFDANLKESARELGEVVVKGRTNMKSGGGAANNFKQERITTIPTVSRNLYDVATLSPMVNVSKVGGISIAGINNRYNSFQIDGTASNDVFGLAASGTNGGQTNANPISMDAIQELQVVIAPFDVRQSGFTGGAINAITKSGTNEFHGSAYGYYNNQDMYGRYDITNNYANSKLANQNTQTYGFTLGGPIIKDKLFFFVSAEYKKKTYPSTYYPGCTSTYITEETAKEIADKYYSLTGIQEGYGKPDIQNQSLGLLARLDWNIDTNNKLSFRYQHNNSYDDTPGLTANTYAFANSGYRMNNSTNSFVAELNSRISDRLYNEARVSANFVRDHRDVDYQGPTVQIKVAGADNTSTNTVNIGTEYSSGANKLNQDIYTIEDNLSWYLGDHTLTFGTHNELYNMENLFIQGVNGAWYYNSLDLFLNDQPYQFTYKYTDPTKTGGDTRYAPKMKAGQLGFYAQDKWDITRNMNVTYGIRFDIPSTLNNPSTNDDFNKFATSNKLGVQVGQMPSVKLMVSPRVGFHLYTDDSHKTHVRGGVGVFTGRVPFVWLSNAYNNTGVEAKGSTIAPKTNGNYTNSAPTLTDYHSDPMTASTLGGSLSPDIVTVSKNFRFPQVMRADLALEQLLPYDVKMTLEGVYSKNLNNVFFENLACYDNGGKVYAVPGVEASASTLYTKRTATNSTDFYNAYSIINLRNTNKGYSYALTATLEKTFDFGLSAFASYSFGHSKSVNDGTSSVASSNWKYNYSHNSNDENELSYSKFDVPHRVKVQVTYESPKYLNGLMNTSVAVIYNGFSGGRYSLTMNEKSDFNNDGWSGNSLLYIPTDEEIDKMNFIDNVNTKTNKVIMDAATSRQLFKDWIASDSYASKHRGQYAERNSQLTPWENEIDLHLSQNVYALKDTKFELAFDILNFANLLNKEWGASYDNAYNLSPLTFAGFANNQTTFYYNTNNKPTASNVNSRWHMQVGLKVTF